MGIFIPSIGFCEYATQPHHTHTSYSFVILLDKDSNFVHYKIKHPLNIIENVKSKIYLKIFIKINCICT